MIKSETFSEGGDVQLTFALERSVISSSIALFVVNSKFSVNSKFMVNSKFLVNSIELEITLLSSVNVS